MTKVPAVCEDGTLRIVHAGRPDTFFSRPAKARIKGEKVFGFVSNNDHNVKLFLKCTNQEEAKKVYRRSIRP